MELLERRVGDVVVLDIGGRLTLGDDSMRLKDKVNSLLHDGMRNILLDLGDVSLHRQRRTGPACRKFYHRQT